jgi:hypothetical protein
MKMSEILDKLKELGYVSVISVHPTLILYNPTKFRTIYLFEDNSFIVGIGPPPFAYGLVVICRTSPTFKEERLIKKLIKLRKEKTNENN